MFTNTNERDPYYDQIQILESKDNQLVVLDPSAKDSFLNME